MRVPDHVVVQALLDELAEPILSSTLILPDEQEPINDAAAIRERLERDVDLIIDAGACAAEPTTVVDLSAPPARIVRRGRGDLHQLGIDEHENT
jgi:tRNA A37 threonylcarbamoyladenosine synthetase subunit TsaC/SUA5/YrdC